ncbi:hypothetical protein D0C36_14540 [Mucilaginibacter conchicola]|uniref:Uncharacterized protein n=1 Tax=Mucilaginibacter conchicola TaxID=2303333 RepID=A0A372NUN7_9SPHI|nr:hypothetical protein [Mucilaginibacter conchicola]RFZ92631.1 hypothetical protein D0C36_14540 [Mucilaginibacter conchicola]
MRLPLIITLACCAILASCSKYQLNVISSTTGKEPNKQTGNYEFENDSVRISYSFYGADAPVTVNVFNKLNEPLYIDWQKSALVIGDKAISYVPDNIKLNGSISADSYTYRGNNNNSVISNPTYTNGSINATANLPKTTTFLPPHTQSTNTTLRLANGFIQVPDTAFHKIRMIENFADTVKLTKVNTALFNESNSPLAFRSYLTTYTVADGKNIPVVYEDKFYVSRTLNTGSDPRYLREFNRQRGDYFISSKASGFGKAMAVTGAVAAIGAAGAVADSQNAKSK